MITLSRMICSARQIEPELGTIHGTCVYCGDETEHGHAFEPTGQFTTYQLIQGGFNGATTIQLWKRDRVNYRKLYI